MSIFEIFWPLMRQFNMNQAINQRQYVIYWYKSNNVGFISICPILLRNVQNKAHMPIFGHTLLGHFDIFGPIELKILMETQETK